MKLAFCGAVKKWSPCSASWKMALNFKNFSPNPALTMHYNGNYWGKIWCCSHKSNFTRILWCKDCALIWTLAIVWEKSSIQWLTSLSRGGQLQPKLCARYIDLWPRFKKHQIIFYRIARIFGTILIRRPAFCGPLDLHSVDFIGLDIESNNYSLTGSLVISNDELSQKIGPKLLFLGFKLPKMETRILWAVYSFHGQLGDEFWHSQNLKILK